MSNIYGVVKGVFMSGGSSGTFLVKLGVHFRPCHIRPFKFLRLLDIFSMQPNYQHLL